MTKEEKVKLIKAEKAEINKDFGEGTVMSLSDKPKVAVEVISTGSLGLDIALGIGGLPRGRVVEIYGPESSGKTTLATHVIAEAQKKGGMAAFVDVEHAFDSDYAEALGVKLDELEICQPESGDQALEVADRLISTGAFDVVVIDSVAALVPKAELEGEVGENKIGLQARLMSQALRKMTPNIGKTNTCVIFINQLREKIGVMFGNPETTSGGNALKFYASVRLDVRRSLTAENSVMDGKEKIGNLTKVSVIKNKVAPPFKKAEFNILYGQGIDKVSEIIDMAHNCEIIKKWGKTITMLDTGTKYDIDAFTDMLYDNPEFCNDIESQIKQKLA